MNKSDIIEELDKLKLKIMIDESIPDDIDRYNDWLDKIQLRGNLCRKPWSILGNQEWARFSTIRSIVRDLFHKKNSGKYEYHKHKPEIIKIVTEAVAMTLFVMEEFEDKLT